MKKSKYSGKKKVKLECYLQKIFAEIYQMLKKKEYHYFRDEKS
jgi:hypothetical protein